MSLGTTRNGAFLCLALCPLFAGADEAEISYEDYSVLEMAAAIASDAESVRAIAAYCPGLRLPPMPADAVIEQAFRAALGIEYETYLQMMAPLADFRLQAHLAAGALAGNLDCEQVALDPFLWDAELGMPNHIARMTGGAPLSRPLEDIMAGFDIAAFRAEQQRAAQEQMRNLAVAIADGAPSIAVVRFLALGDVPAERHLPEWADAPDDAWLAEVRHGWKDELPDYIPVRHDPRMQPQELYLVSVEPAYDGYQLQPIHPDLVPLVIQQLGPVQWRRIEAAEPEPRHDEQPRRPAGQFAPGVIG